MKIRNDTRRAKAALDIAHRTIQGAEELTHYREGTTGPTPSGASTSPKPEEMHPAVVKEFLERLGQALSQIERADNLIRDTIRELETG